jgi:hypothetical protein
MIEPAEMRLSDPGDWELIRLRWRYVAGRYLNLLNGNFLHRGGRWQRSWFLWRLRADARRISDADLRILLSSDWRARLTAAWLIAGSGREQFVGELGALFTQSAVVYSGQGYAIALAAIGGPDSADQLDRYLSEWLPRRESRYDQDWAMGALAYLDSVTGTTRAAHFTDSGAWDQWADEYDDLATMTALVHDLVRAIGRAR